MVRGSRIHCVRDKILALGDKKISKNFGYKPGIKHGKKKKKTIYASYLLKIFAISKTRSASFFAKFTLIF